MLSIILMDVLGFIIWLFAYMDHIYWLYNVCNVYKTYESYDISYMIVYQIKLNINYKIENWKLKMHR